MESFPIAPARLARALACGWVVIAGGGLTAELIDQFRGTPGRLGMFSLSYEGNLPTWYSACLLLLCSAMLSLIACSKRSATPERTLQWWGLSILFAYVSLDESVGFHELMNAWFDLGGVLYFGWIIPAALILLTLAALYWKFLWNLPLLTRRRFLVAAVVFVTGGLGLELPLGYWTDLTRDDESLTYVLIDSSGEALELLGTSLFLAAVVRHFDLECARREPASG